MKNKKKVLFVASVVKMHINVFHLPYLKWFKDNNYITYVCAKNDFKSKECVIPYCDEYHNIPFERLPFSIGNIRAYTKLKKVINENQFDIIHCNTPVASILTRLIARKTRKKGTKVVYTAHGFHFFKGSSWINWILYFPIEWFCSFFTDVLITINKEDYNLATTKMKAKKIEYVNGVGIDLEKSKNIAIDKFSKRRELGIPEDALVLLSVGELSKRKNHQVIIKALGKISNPNIYYLICGQGDLKDELQMLAKKLGVDKNLLFLGFRSDILEICSMSDVFCFPSLQEGLPVALMEAMSIGLPIICSDIRGNTDLIEPREGGYLYNPNDIDGFVDGINELLNDNVKCSYMTNYNIKKIGQFGKHNIELKMSQIYTELMRGEKCQKKK